LDEAIELDNDTIYCGASMGLRVSEPGESAEQLMMEADIAMYASKAEGRNRLRIFEPSMLHERQLRSQLAEDLKRAIRDSELLLHYQPIVELATGRIEGVEALVRWNHPERGMIMPDEFLPIAEDAGLMPELGGWVLRTAVEQLSYWRKNGAASPDLSIRVNIAATDLQRLEFIEEVREILTSFDISPGLLVLELTEQAFITGNELDRYSLSSLRKLGIGLEIDDFGTGYSSISYLRRLPVDRVKVDRSILKELGTDPSQPALIAAVLQLIRACGLEAVWEGVESAEQAEYLRSIGCISAQGYYYSRPLPGPDIALLLQGESNHWQPPN
jgi:EAL domain-containing protein (putative c-di-GMP-specific phosphodiesterase class I)